MDRFRVGRTQEEADTHYLEASLLLEAYREAEKLSGSSGVLQGTWTKPAKRKLYSIMYVSQFCLTVAVET